MIKFELFVTSIWQQHVINSSANSSAKLMNKPHLYKDDSDFYSFQSLVYGLLIYNPLAIPQCSTGGECSSISTGGRPSLFSFSFYSWVWFSWEDCTNMNKPLYDKMIVTLFIYLYGLYLYIYSPLACPQYYTAGRLITRTCMYLNVNVSFSLIKIVPQWAMN